MLETGIGGQALHLDEARLSIDFTNTADWHASAQPEEELTDYGALVRWAEQKGVLPAEQALRLQEKAAMLPEQAAAVVQRAVALREAIYHIFAAIARGGQAQQKDIDAINRALATTLPLLRVAPTGGEFSWRWAGYEDALDCMLWPVAQSAAELLTSEDVHKIGQCADDRGCGWIFLDTSKNHSRRWCSMTGCGNRAKAQRHSQRARHGEGETR